MFPFRVKEEREGRRVTRVSQEPQDLQVFVMNCFDKIGNNQIKYLQVWTPPVHLDQMVYHFQVADGEKQEQQPQDLGLRAAQVMQDQPEPEVPAPDMAVPVILMIPIRMSTAPSPPIPTTGAWTTTTTTFPAATGIKLPNFRFGRQNVNFRF